MWTAQSPTAPTTSRCTRKSAVRGMEIIAGSTVMQGLRYSARAGSSTRTSNVVLLWASHPAATACVTVADRYISLFTVTVAQITSCDACPKGQSSGGGATTCSTYTHLLLQAGN